jgi:hypothetical protein
MRTRSEYTRRLYDKPTGQVLAKALKKGSLGIQFLQFVEMIRLLQVLRPTR